MGNDSGVSYIETDEKDLDLIAPLWHKLRLHHKERAREAFKSHFDQFTFKERKNQLLDRAKNGAMLVNLAKNNQTGDYIGYCVSRIDAEKHAELESIFIEKDYRKLGIGGHFMKIAVNWMDKHGAIEKNIVVAGGNEEAFGFYEKYGFYPRAHILRQAEIK